MIQIDLNGKSVQLQSGSEVKKLAEYKTDTLLCGAYVNQRIKSLEYKLKDGESVRLIGLDDPAGMRIYMSTLMFVFSKACQIVYPDKEISISYSLGGGIFCEFQDKTPMHHTDVSNIKDEMKHLIERSVHIKKHKIPWKDAYVFMRHHKMTSATDPDLLMYVDAWDISLYEIEDFYGYYYSKVLSDTKDLYAFDLIHLKPGCVLLGPDPKNLKLVKNFVSQPNLHREFQEYEAWCAKLDVSDVVSLNRKIENGTIKDLITVAEARHEQLISEMADRIYEQGNEKRVVLIAGPSSAGKTTTSKRLRAHLVAKGMNPVAISLDDYFVNRELTPKNEKGEYDFEDIGALDVELFNQNMIELMDGKEAEIPIFNFIEGKRLPNGRKLKVDANSPIIIEGIHGLNEGLTWQIPKRNKYKIYLNDLTHLNIDQNNRIPTSDVRLIRRIVRDIVKRGHNAEATISMWQAVRKGEEKNIYPYSNEADFVFNSSLFYEMSVLKKYAEPALADVKDDSDYFAEASRLLSFLSFFLAYDDERPIYADSILREFIGGSIFEDL